MAAALAAPEGVAVVLRGPSQVGKTTFLNRLLEPDHGELRATGDGSGESVTQHPELLRTRAGLVVDGPGDNDSRLRFSNEEAGRRYAVAVAAAGVGRVKFLLFESMGADTMQLRASLASLQTAFGARALEAVVVVLSKADLKAGVARERRLTAVRELMAERGIPELVVWTSEVQGEAFDEQLADLLAALGRVPGAPTTALEDLWQRQRRLAQELCDRQPPRTREVEVEESVVVPYTEQEAYQAQEAYTEPEHYEEQEPYTEQEAYEEPEPYDCDETYVENEPYTELETRMVSVQVEKTKRRGGVAGMLGGRKSYTVTEQRPVQVEVQKLRPVNRTRTVTKFRTVAKRRTVTKYRTVTRSRPITKFREVTLFRDATKYRTETRMATQTVEYRLPVEDFHAEALQRILEEIRSTFASDYVDPIDLGESA